MATKTKAAKPVKKFYPVPEALFRELKVAIIWCLADGDGSRCPAFGVNDLVTWEAAEHREMTNDDLPIPM